MKKSISKQSFLLFWVIAAASFILSLFGFGKSRVTADLDKMLSDKNMGIYSHTIVYAQKHPELYNDILDLGENAIEDLMRDFADHPEDNLRRQLIIDLVDTIVQQEGLDSEVVMQSLYSSNSDWFGAVGKDLYEKCAGKIRINHCDLCGLNNESFYCSVF